MLIAIKSCERDRLNGCHDAIRQTWGADLHRSTPLRFFTGVPAGIPNIDNLKQDEICLGVPDGYDDLARKTRAICRWALNNTEQDYLFLADNDCCVYPDRLRFLDYRNYDYGGKFNGKFGEQSDRELVIRTNEAPVIIPQCWSWASGGGYFLSRKAYKLVAESQDADKYGFAEDVFVGQIVQNAGLKAIQIFPPLAVYYVKDGHSKGYDPKSNWMRYTYEKGKYAI